MLWIAFIFQYLWDTKQHNYCIKPRIISCELLSFFSIFGIQNNSSLESSRLWQLWIAFIFQYLWDTKQLNRVLLPVGIGCELLSFFSIFGIQNNDKLEIEHTGKVVNCFHFSVSLGYKTTFWITNITFSKLWIAFIFQYLWDTKQQLGSQSFRINRCELLSFFSIFGIQNN